MLAQARHISDFAERERPKANRKGAGAFLPLSRHPRWLPLS
jgi:hypothetical protein